jgi:hypothetical protein
MAERTALVAVLTIQVHSAGCCADDTSTQRWLLC